MTSTNYKLENLRWGEVIELPSSRSLRNTAHIIGGRYPCRSVAYIPRMILASMPANKDICVLDPFMGSGTTAVETIYRGFKSFGLEVDPFARLISEVSAHCFTLKERDEILWLHSLIVKKFPSQIVDVSLSPITKNIEYWFEEKNFADLLKLKTLIFSRSKSNSVKRFFLAVMADIIRASSKAERQSLKPYISKKYIKKTNDVFASYIKSFESYLKAIHIENEIFLDSNIEWLEGDATNFRSRKKMDVAITSPPYINAMDYVRCIKLESAWIGTGDDEVFNSVRKKQLGEQVRNKASVPNSIVMDVASPKLEYLKAADPVRYRTALSYFQDMYDNLLCVNSALKRNAYYHVIVGNSVIRSQEVATHEIIADLAKKVGFEWEGYFCYPIKDHRTSLPRNGNGGKISVEHVISLRKKIV